MKLLKATFLAGAISLLMLTGAHAQDNIYRCGGEYTNTVTEAQAKTCKLISPSPTSDKPHDDIDAFLDAPAPQSAKPTKDQLAQLARELEGTIYVIPHRESADGVLTACGLEFAALRGDFSTKQGAPVKVVGSFYLRPNDRTGLAYVLKLGAFDGIGTESEAGFAPANAFIRAPNGITPKKAIRAEAENNGFALFVGALDKDALAAFSGIMEKSQLIVGFNRKAGQQDVTFKLDLKVIDTQMDGRGKVIRKKSDQPVTEFVACSMDLIKAASANLK